MQTRLSEVKPTQEVSKWRAKIQKFHHHRTKQEDE